MNLKEALGYLVDNDYLVIMDGLPIITQKLRQELRPPGVAAVVLVEKLPAVVRQEVGPVKRITKGKRTDQELRNLWHKFVEDTEIPWRVQTSTGGSYTVRQYGPTAATRLATIIDSPDVDYQTLVIATKYYYKNTTYKAILSNYIIQDLWLNEYNELLKRNGQPEQRDDGSHWAET